MRLIPTNNNIKYNYVSYCINVRILGGVSRYVSKAFKPTYTDTG